jgi:hypothetical protein
VFLRSSTSELRQTKKHIPYNTSNTFLVYSSKRSRRCDFILEAASKTFRIDRGRRFHRHHTVRKTSVSRTVQSVMAKNVNDWPITEDLWILRVCGQYQSRILQYLAQWAMIVRSARLSQSICSHKTSCALIKFRVAPVPDSEFFNWGGGWGPMCLFSILISLLDKFHARKSAIRESALPLASCEKISYPRVSATSRLKNWSFLTPSLSLWRYLSLFRHPRWGTHSRPVVCCYCTSWTRVRLYSAKAHPVRYSSVSMWVLIQRSLDKSILLHRLFIKNKFTKGDESTRGCLCNNLQISSCPEFIVPLNTRQAATYSSR